MEEQAVGCDYMIRSERVAGAVFSWSVPYGFSAARVPFPPFLSYSVTNVFCLMVRFSSSYFSGVSEKQLVTLSWESSVPALHSQQNGVWYLRRSMSS